MEDPIGIRTPTSKTTHGDDVTTPSKILVEFRLYAQGYHA